ncbi:hypothetical protein I79_001703 [Cricetulus griseus]|uniref:Uncharacterized protein n=1 Tax=Cricetulus griseus TaxID=10029 RepID=G3GVG5_CRIGR|nr:hypothetical protein I79_001703 [Cricetulus griseus]
MALMLLFQPPRADLAPRVPVVYPEPSETISQRVAGRKVLGWSKGTRCHQAT